MYDLSDWDPGYAQHRFAGTWVFSKVQGLLRYRGAQKENGQLFLDCRDVDNRQVYAAVPELQLESPRLGFVEMDGAEGIEAIFVRKYPLRRDWRQGIRPSQLGAYSLRGVGVDADPLFGNRRNLSRLNNTLLSRFNSLEEASWKVNEEYTSCALSISFALDEEHRLFYENYGAVGRLQQDHTFVLDNQFKFLKERIGKELGVDAK